MKGKSTFTRSEADAIIELIELKLRSDRQKQKGIRNRIRKLGFYASDFGIGGGYTAEDFKRCITIIREGSDDIIGIEESKATESNHLTGNLLDELKASITKRKREDSDEAYILDLCDELLRQRSVRQAKFDFLIGDSGSKLPCDAYYPNLKLVVEYREKQHTESVKLFDRRKTVSGVSRGEQRIIYDQRRRDVLPKNGLKLIEIGYHEFDFDSSKRLVELNPAMAGQLGIVQKTA